MAAEKTTVKKDAPKATASVKANALKTDLKTEVKPVVEVKATETKTAAPKKAAAKAAAATKEVAKKAATTTKKAATTTKKAATTAKKTVAKAAKTVAPKKTATKTNITLEYSDKKYTAADLEKIASDVWVYDYGKKAADLKSVELYVKPFENRVYYVFNGDVVGSFQI
ncbi:MAG: DNA-binding protein [Lachnospiraceae bacterium]|nr:DNA-binding protein [Candidatus Colinaster scatohippi]